MPSFRTTRRVRHSASAMFDLVADVERYPEFVPLCQALRVRRHASAPNGAEIVIAEMEIGYKAIRERFTSRVTLDRAAQKIIVEYIDGPFSHMQNVWTFADDGPDASNVEFFIDYQFKSRILGALMGSMFDTAFRRFTAAFEARADALDPKPAG